jgi:hypothetical protein
MSLLQCEHFWWKLIDMNLFNPIFYPNVVLRASPLVCSFQCFARDYLQTGYSDMLDISWSGIHYNFIGKKIRKRRHGFLTTLQESRIKKMATMKMNQVS